MTIPLSASSERFFGAVLLEQHDKRATAWRCMRDSIPILMVNAPAEIDLAAVCAARAEIPQVRNVHHPHAWTLTSGKHIFSAHLRAEPDTPAARQAQILDEAQALLSSRFGFYFATIQIETFERDESKAVDLDLARAALRQAGPRS